MTDPTTAPPAPGEIIAGAVKALRTLGVELDELAGPHEARSPITGELLARTVAHTEPDVDAALAAAQKAFLACGELPLAQGVRFL